jgi:hypothetical protein
MAEGPEKVFVVVKFVEGDYEVVSKHWLRFDKSDKKTYCWFPTIPDTVGKLLEKHPQTFLDTDGDRGAVHLYPLDHPPYPGHYFVGKCSHLFFSSTLS